MKRCKECQHFVKFAGIREVACTIGTLWVRTVDPTDDKACKNFKMGKAGIKHDRHKRQYPA